jgi:enoyl-CoA hydratase/carnithine racemase
VLEIHLEAAGMNALGTPLLERVEAILDSASGQPILLTGEGPAFSAGLDLKEVAGLDLEGMKTFLGRLERVSNKLFNHPAPTVACVNGHAIAGGCILAIACDYRVAANVDHARIGLNEVAIGLRFPPMILRLLRYRLGDSNLEKAVLGGRLHSPQAALDLGLVDEVADDALAVAKKHLAALSSHPPDAYAAAKAALRSGVTDVSAEESRAFVEEVVPVWVSEPVKAQIRAVLTR